MKQLSRLDIQRMIDTSGSAGSGGSGGNDISLAGYATEAWVEDNYLSKEFFLRLFGIHGTDENDDPVDVEPNDPDTTITDIEAKYGFWSDSFVSAFGLGEGGGGGGGGSDTLADLIDVELTNLAAGQVLKYNGTKWINSAASTGTVTSVAMSVPTGFAVTGSPITVSGVLGLSFADGYSLPTTAKQTNWDAAYSWTSVSRTTLADYGITDAKFGTPGTDSIPITLGSTTQSVLTQHQSLANYYTKSETDGKFLTISFFRSLFRAYNSSNTEVEPNDGSTSTIASIKAMFGFWTEQYISALGQSSGGGGGVTLNQPLSAINTAELNNATSNGQALVYNGSVWKYSNTTGTNLRVGGTLSVTGDISTGGTVTGTMFSGAGFKISGLSNGNNYVLLAGGGTKLLSEIGGGGSVNSITIGSGGTNYTPDANGVVTIPAYVTLTGTQTITGGKTFSGTTNSILTVDRNSTNPTWIKFAKNGTVLGYLGVNNSNKARFHNGTNDYEIWHSGNLTPSDYALASSVYSKTEADGYFMRISDYTNIQSRATSDAHYSLNNLTDEGVYGITNNNNAAYFDDRPVTGSTAFRVVVFRTRNSSDYLCQEYQQSGSTAVYQRYTSSGSFANSTWYLVQSNLANYALASELSSYALSANVYSKTDVNGFTWWGRSLSNGAVSGDMTGVGDMTFATSTNSRQLSIGKSGTISLKAATARWSASYSVKTNDGSVVLGGFGFYGSGDTLSRLYIGDSYTNPWASFLPSGNVGIGTTSPTSKLHVDGTFNATGNSTIGGTFGVTGAATLSSTLDVTGLMTLSDYLYMDTGKPIYWKDNGNTYRNVLYLVYTSSANLVRLGYGTASQGYNTYIYGNNVMLLYGTSRTTGLQLDSSGNVGIGTTSPSAKLHVNGAVRIGSIYIGEDSNGNLEVYKLDSSNNHTAANFYATGGVSALGQSSSGTTYLDQATADARYLRLTGGTVTGNISANGNISVSSTLKTTTGSASAYWSVGTSSVNSSYTLYVNGNAGIKNIVIGNEEQVNTVNCAVIRTLNSRGIYIKSGSAPNYVDGTWVNASDIRLKDIVNYAGASVEQVANAPVFNYKWKAGGTQVMLGTKAQYWKDVFQFGVSEGPDSYLYMDYASIALASAVMVARKVQSHEERIAALEAENARLQKELNEIKAA